MKTSENLLCRNQSVDLLGKSMDWFLYDRFSDVFRGYRSGTLFENRLKPKLFSFVLAAANINRK